MRMEDDRCLMLERKTTSIIVSGVASGWSILWLADLLAMFFLIYRGRWWGRGGGGMRLGGLFAKPAKWILPFPTNQCESASFWNISDISNQSQSTASSSSVRGKP